uniref:Prolyl endopeptidase n=1 Tax=Rhizophora mucronata TaxID=61149 RepID=A0A2P2JTM7_RHIMU
MMFSFGSHVHAQARFIVIGSPYIFAPRFTCRCQSLAVSIRPPLAYYLHPRQESHKQPLLLCSGSPSSRCSSHSTMGSLSATNGNLQYPIARRDESVVDEYHGVKIADPYRWLEDPDAEEVKEFVKQQAELTESILKTCDTRDKLRDKITKLFDYPRYDAPFKRGNKYFYFHNTGLQAQSVLYVQENLDAEAEVLLDPNALSEDGTVSLNIISVSEDAKYLAYGLSASGSDWVTIKVMRIEDKTVEAETLSWVKFSGISWTHDSKGFFYSRYPAPKYVHIVPFCFSLEPPLSKYLLTWVSQI